MTIGLETKVLINKDWMNPTRAVGIGVSAYATPHLLFLKKWKIQLESRIDWVIGRGIHLEMILGMRWEIFPKTVLEAAVGMPVFGGAVHRLLVGFSFGLGRTRVVLRAYDIHFPPDSPDLWGFADAAKIAANRVALNKLADQIKGYPDYDILIEGHTSSVHWADPKEFEREQREEMLPPSEARAAAVRSALTELGIDASRISSVGKGGSEPIVACSLSDQQWRNRRVDVVLTKRQVVE